MQIVVYSRIYKPNDHPYIQHLFDELFKSDCEVFVHSDYHEQIKDKIKFKKGVQLFYHYEDFKKYNIDFVITLGGDGTILSAATLVKDSNVPIAGINLGRLGFLASVGKDYIHDSVHALLSNNFKLDERSLLHLESCSPLFGNNNIALNDFTVLKRDTSSMIVIHTFINGEFLNSYWADGLIVSTPTGSTGYSLSCGGPIIFPRSGNFVITPVAPHNLNVRPIVLSDESVISFEIEGRADSFLCTLDSRFAHINSRTQLAVSRADFTLKLARFEGKDFHWTIREKLSWGIDVRN